MASTNKTTNYELSQYIGTDKPTYLGDYNSDMGKIDVAIKGVDTVATAGKNKADANESHIGTLSDLETTVKTDIVSSINEVNEKTSKIGNVNTLNTTVKTDTVGAINEVNNKVNKLSLTNVVKYNASNIAINNGTISGGDITVASNSDYSVLKLYGNIKVNSTSGSWATYLYLENAIPEGYRPSEDITVNPVGVLLSGNVGSTLSATIYTNGTILISMTKGTNTGFTATGVLIPFLIFVKNFGDVVPE